jgi:hypothetical protein
MAVVSVPAMKAVIASSRSCRSQSGRPCSSRAASSMESKSPRSSPLSRRFRMKSYVMRSSARVASRSRSPVGVGIASGSGNALFMWRESAVFTDSMAARARSTSLSRRAPNMVLAATSSVRSTASA